MNDDTEAARSCEGTPWLDHQYHSSVCWCLNDSAECCRPNCTCHDDDPTLDYVPGTSYRYDEDIDDE